MKITENVTIYQCDHCSKKMVRRKAMINHELMCYNNPENKSACNNCLFLKKIQVEYGEKTYSIHDNKWIQSTTTGFKCTKLNQTMYPFKAEKYGLPDKYPETFENQVPMPKSCELYDGENFPW